MKKYQVIDLQGCNFMGDTEDEPMTASQLRSRFWSLEDCRADSYAHFTLNYIREMWQVDFELKRGAK